MTSKIITKIIESTVAPKTGSVLWLDVSNPLSPILKYLYKGRWFKVGMTPTNSESEGALDPDEDETEDTPEVPEDTTPYAKAYSWTVVMDEESFGLISMYFPNGIQVLPTSSVEINGVSYLESVTSPMGYNFEWAVQDGLKVEMHINDAGKPDIRVFKLDLSASDTFTVSSLKIDGVDYTLVSGFCYATTNPLLVPAGTTSTVYCGYNPDCPLLTSESVVKVNGITLLYNDGSFSTSTGNVEISILAPYDYAIHITNNSSTSFVMQTVSVGDIVYNCV